MSKDPKNRPCSVRDEDPVRTATSDMPARRELLRNSLGALGSLVVFSKLQACTRDASLPTSSLPAAVGGGHSVPSAAAPSQPVAFSAGAPAPAPLPSMPTRVNHTAGSSGANAADDSDAGMSGQLPGNHPDKTDIHVACATITRFPKITDDGPRSTFTRMDQGDALEWLTTGFSAALYAVQLPDCILFMLRALDNVQAGYPLSILQHSLQTATRARRANASDDLVLGALCHHIGMTIMFEGQAELSAAILRGFVSEEAYRVVRHQAEYQWSHYGDRVGLPTQQRARYAAQSWHAQAVAFSDEWDSPAYDPAYKTLPLAELEPLLRAKLGPESGYLVGQLTSTDCIAKGS